MALATLDDILEARRRIHGITVRTPLLPCPWASDGERSLFLKPENLQLAGAFKIRGAYNRMSALSQRERARGVIAQSSGNHGQALAYAARILGVKAVVVMPDTAARVKIEATRAQGAEVLLVPPEDREKVTGRLAEEQGYVVVSPFDDPHIIAGQGTVGLEICEDATALGLELDTVLVPVSGGGLISGVAAAMKLQRPEVRVIGVEPEFAADARESFHSGQRVSWPAAETGRTIADGLRISSVGALPFEHIQAYVDDIITVRESDIRATVAVLAREGHLIAEPSGAVATAAYLYQPDALPAGRVYASVVSGGNIDPAMLVDLLTQ
ncbi:threonine ammonia-lyase [Sphaerisporangium corydalis]|uniref:Threonine/serine dehydratase n=1 Tax=Sphaerisporangium corydalis TaxID=1441875 RepID=A0ABV9EDE6_9ACTN|nr:threonine/serine dehydratase [Sphaerisporangium corydalis]